MSKRPERPDLELAMAQLHKNLEEADGVPAIITEAVWRPGGGGSGFMAVVGTSQEIGLEPYKGGRWDSPEDEVRIGDVVLVKERTTRNFTDSVTSMGDP